MPDQTYQKLCTKCGATKDASEFAHASESKDGLHWWCKSCFQRNGADRRQARKRGWTPADPNAPKLCTACGLTKSVREFSTQRMAKDGLDWRCRDCVRRYRITRELARLGPITGLPPDAQGDEISPQYAAGFFDGEGNVSIGRSSMPQWGRPHYYTFGVSIANTNLEVLTRIQRTFGGTVKKKKVVPKHHKESYWCSLRSWTAYEFLLRVLPFLIVKRQQAELGIQFQQTMRHAGNRWGPTPQEEWDRREALYQEMKRLNARGRKI